jgi:hypothetical protein
MIPKRLVGLVAVAVLALGGTAHAADYDPAGIQASIDKAVAAAGAGATGVQTQGPSPYAANTEEQIVDGTAFGLVGNASANFTTGSSIRTQGRQVEVVQSATPEQAKQWWLVYQGRLEKNAVPPNGPAKGFKTRKVKGHPVVFFDAKVTGTGSSGSIQATDAEASFVDGRNVLTFQIIALDPARSRLSVRKWVAAYLKAPPSP